jgi:hypothetical protein
MKPFLYEQRLVFRSETFSGKKDSRHEPFWTRNGPKGVIKNEYRTEQQSDYWPVTTDSPAWNHLTITSFYSGVPYITYTFE